MSGRGALPSRREIWLVVCLVAVGVLLRVLFPGADAIHPRWYGWMTDEGRWTELAREWALFRSPDLDSPVSRIHLIMAPLFQGAVALAFEVGGVTLEAARLPSRIAGIALLLTAALGLRRALHSWAWVTAVALVALHPELLYLSRVAIPEMPALVTGFLAFLLVVRPDGSPRTDLLAGVFTLAAVAFKATTGLYIPALALAILVVGPTLDGRSAPARLRSWGIGVGLPLVIGAGVTAARVGFEPPGAGGVVSAILHFVDFKNAYDFGTTFLMGDALDDVNLILAILCPLVVAVSLRDPPDSGARRIHRGAMAWAVWWVAALLALDYFPPRYVVHLHLALILAVSGAVALLSDPRGRSLADGWTSWSVRRRVVAGAVVALPLAVVAVPAGLVALEFVGPRLDRVRIMGPLVLLVALAVGTVGARRPVGWVFGPSLLVFPLAAAVIWRGIHGPAVDRYWVIDASTEFIPWVFAILGGLAAAWAWGRSPRSDVPGISLPAGAVAYVCALVVLWTGIRHVPSLVQTSYDLEALSETLTERYPAGDTLGVGKLTSALIETPFRYRELGASERIPDAVVTSILSPDMPPDTVAARGFRTVVEFELPVFLFRRMPRPVDQPLFFDRVPVQLLER